MRVGFFGQTGPFAPPVLRHLLAQRHDVELALVVEGKRTASGAMEHRLRQPHPGPLPSGDGLADLARAAGVPVLETADVNAATAIATIQGHRLDWLVCAGFDRLFSPALLAAASRGALNAHPSMLPRWRGPSPLFWTLRSGDRSAGVTVHTMDEREDHGPIHAQASFALPRRATGDQLYRLAATVAAPLLLDVLRRARSGPLEVVPQDESLATRARRSTPEDAHVLPAEWDCEPLVDFCCGAPFFRTPWLRLDGEVVLVERGLSTQPGGRLPGDYLREGRTLTVQCRDGLARLELRV